MELSWGVASSLTSRISASQSYGARYGVRVGVGVGVGDGIGGGILVGEDAPQNSSVVGPLPSNPLLVWAMPYCDGSDVGNAAWNSCGPCARNGGGGGGALGGGEDAGLNSVESEEGGGAGAGR